MAPVRVKICGITCEQDALAALQAGASAVGLVFYPPSPRYLADLALAQRIALSLGPFVSVVGLFVNASASAVQQVLAQVPLQVLQFHGDEPAAFCEQFERPYLKAVRMKPGLALEPLMAQHPKASGFLLDAYKPGVPGGTGEAFDWAAFPRHAPKPLVLAGGLTPNTVAQAIEQTSPYGVDVSGGVESAPGVKDHAKIRCFMQQVQSLSTSSALGAML